MKVSAAGSRKTQGIIDEALSYTAERVLVTTFTQRNQWEIVSRITKAKGCVPENLRVMGWFQFLIGECARPYQRALTGQNFIAGLNFNCNEAPRGIRKEQTRKYFFDQKARFYRGRVADFVCTLESEVGGQVMRRLSDSYTHIFVDEFQDLAGYDLDVLDLLIRADLSLTLVGDPRQRIYATHLPTRNQKYRAPSGIFHWLKDKARVNRLTIRSNRDCYRSNQAICDFADSIFPELPKTRSMVRSNGSLDPCGVLAVRRVDALDYYERVRPVVLRPERTTDTLGLPAQNVGESKGLSFDHVLLFPTPKWASYFKDRQISILEGAMPEKLYVAVTRARHSVAFVVDDQLTLF